MGSNILLNILLAPFPEPPTVAETHERSGRVISPGPG
jgi:hypothetical protein